MFSLSHTALRRGAGPAQLSLCEPVSHEGPSSLTAAPRAAFPSACLAAQTKRWAEGQPGRNPAGEDGVGCLQPHLSILPGEFQGRGNLVGCHLWGRTELDTTEVT